MNALDKPLILPLPPSRNNLTRHANYRHYPSKAYLEWLELSVPLLRKYLGDAEPQDGWFIVQLYLHLGTRHCDADAYSKAVLDLLQGTMVGEGGKIVRGNGLYRDDKQVAEISTCLIETHLPPEQTQISVWWYTHEGPKKYVKPRKSRTKGEVT